MAISNPTHINTTVDGSGAITTKVSGSMSTISDNAFLIAALALGAVGTTNFAYQSMATTLSNVSAWTNRLFVNGTSLNRYVAALTTAQVTGDPGTGTITHNWTTASSRTVLSIIEILSNDPLQVIQTKSAFGNSTSQAVTFDSPVGANSIVILAVNSAGATGVTHDANTTELAENSSTGGANSRLQIAYRNGSNPPQTYTVTGLGTTNNVIVAMELSEAPAGPTIPEAPTIGAIVPSDGSVSIAWTDNGDGGDPTGESHDIEVEKDAVAGDVRLDTGDTSPIIVSGLENAHDYRIRVRRNNSIGNSNWSDWSARVTPMNPANSSSGGRRRGGGSIYLPLVRFSAISRSGGGGSGSGEGGLVLPAGLVRSSEPYELFESVGEWTATAGSIAQNTTSGEFTEGTGGIKLTTDGTSNCTMNKVISDSFDSDAGFQIDVTVHNVAPASVSLMLSTNSGFTEGMQWTMSVPHLGRNRIRLRKSAASFLGSPTWDSTFIRARVSYAGGASGRAVTVDNLRRNVIGEPAVFLTWDDEHDEQLSIVDPLLATYNMKTTLYISSSFVGTAGRCTWSQLRDLHDLGHTTCSHTRLHTNLTTLSHEDGVDEIVNGINDMVANGLPLVEAQYFAYPFATGWSQATIAMALEAGCVYSRTGYGANAVSPFVEPHRIECRLFVGAPGTIADTAKGWIDDAKNKGEQLWTITHTIGSGLDITEADLIAVVDHCRAQKVPILSIGQYHALQSGPLTIPHQW